MIQKTNYCFERLRANEERGENYIHFKKELCNRLGLECTFDSPLPGNYSGATDYEVINEVDRLLHKKYKVKEAFELSFNDKIFIDGVECLVEGVEFDTPSSLCVKLHSHKGINHYWFRPQDPVIVINGD